MNFPPMYLGKNDDLVNPLAENVFQADALIQDWCVTPLELGLWYWADVTWKIFEGPFDTKAEANARFQGYLVALRICDSCED